MTIQAVFTFSYKWMNSPPQLKRCSGHCFLPVPEKMTLNQSGGIIYSHSSTHSFLVFPCKQRFFPALFFPKPMCACVCYWNNDPAVCISHNSSVGCMLECDRLVERGNCSRVTPLSGSRSLTTNPHSLPNEDDLPGNKPFFRCFSLQLLHSGCLTRDAHIPVVQSFGVFPLFLPHTCRLAHNAAVQWQIINIKCCAAFTQAEK